MLTPSCQYEESLFVLILNWITSFISIPIYGISFIVLLMKCPKHFEEYRKYLVIHIISNSENYLITSGVIVVFFLPFDSKLFIVFYIFAYSTVLLVVIAGILAAIETLRALNSNNLRLSPKTTAIQKNFMFSLIVSVTVHLTLICIPLALHFFVSFYSIHNQYIAPLGILMIQDHGTVSTFTMIITNKLLRKATRKLFLIPENLLRKSEPRMFKRKHKNTSGINVLN